MRKALSLALGGALAAALVLPVAAQAAPTTLVASLDGAGETAGGDADGSGSFSAQVNPDAGDLCYVLSVKDVGNVAAAHIHEGAAGQDGKPVITIGTTGEGLDECVAAEPDLLKAIVAAPANYYVNVHTAEHPKGAVRGQLSKKAQ